MTPEQIAEHIVHAVNGNAYRKHEVAEMIRRACDEAINEAMDDKRRLTREIDVGMFGDGAAKRASLCDLVEPAQRLGRLRVAAKRISNLLSEFDGDYQYIDQELWDELWEAADAA